MGPRIEKLGLKRPTKAKFSQRDPFRQRRRPAQEFSGITSDGSKRLEIRFDKGFFQGIRGLGLRATARADIRDPMLPDVVGHQVLASFSHRRGTRRRWQ